MKFFHKNKKAAMFGLDARIALAIFGALSVITGAALYSAIGNAKTTALLTEMQEVGKAWEAYYLDTGHNLPKEVESPSSNAGYYVLRTSELVSNLSNVKGWKGPYLNLDVASHYLAVPGYFAVRLITVTNSNTWGESLHWANDVDAKCPSGDSCYLWVNLLGVEPEDPVISQLDEKIDKGDGGNSGDFRWMDSGTAWKTRLYFKYAPIKNPNS